ncbi:hypothetical protein RJ641_035611 [Dillenia turbinata]|uniref:Uncharacterized protein n=1 Tax=Dillenia turbinata TaxID=194707 RepID=A0AAN8VTB8_9MAGN
MFTEAHFPNDGNNEGAIFALYSFLCSHAKLSLPPNYQAADEKLSADIGQGRNINKLPSFKLKRILDKHKKSRMTSLVIVLFGAGMVTVIGALAPPITSNCAFCIRESIFYCIQHCPNGYCFVVVLSSVKSLQVHDMQLMKVSTSSSQVPISMQCNVLVARGVEGNLIKLSSALAWSSLSNAERL